jgi:hypothetical protein
MNVSALCKKVIGTLAIASAALGATGCGEFVRSSRSPSQLVIASLTAKSGGSSSSDSGTLLSDVLTDNGSIFSDTGSVSLRLQLRDPGTPGVASSPTAINEVTITRYRVVYRRADGRNTEGVDIPYSFDSAFTVTVPADGNATGGFDIVRHAAKLEPPLSTLRSGETFITTIAEVTFYGHDQAGNEVSVTGTIGITFGNFAG